MRETGPAQNLTIFPPMTSKNNQQDLFELSTETGQDQIGEDGFRRDIFRYQIEPGHGRETLLTTGIYSLSIFIGDPGSSVPRP